LEKQFYKLLKAIQAFYNNKARLYE